MMDGQVEPTLAGEHACVVTRMFEPVCVSYIHVSVYTYI